MTSTRARVPPQKSTYLPPPESASKKRRTAANDPLPRAVTEALRTSGRPLESDVRELARVRLGFDFDQVRVHADSMAAAAAETLSAEAFTCGQDIFFAAGNYQPHTDEGFRRLAHELAHTVQQRGGSPASHIDQPHLADNEGLEREAEHAADWVAAGRTLSADTLTVGSAAARGRIACLVRHPDRMLPRERPAVSVLVETLAVRLQAALRTDPNDASGRVRRQLQQLEPSVREAVLGRLQTLTPTDRWERLKQLLVSGVPEAEQGDAATPATVETTAQQTVVETQPGPTGAASDASSTTVSAATPTNVPTELTAEAAAPELTADLAAPELTGETTAQPVAETDGVPVEGPSAEAASVVEGVPQAATVAAVPVAAGSKGAPAGGGGSPAIEASGAAEESPPAPVALVEPTQESAATAEPIAEASAAGAASSAIRTAGSATAESAAAELPLQPRGTESAVTESAVAESATTESPVAEPVTAVTPAAESPATETTAESVPTEPSVESAPELPPAVATEVTPPPTAIVEPAMDSFGTPREAAADSVRGAAIEPSVTPETVTQPDSAEASSAMSVDVGTAEASGGGGEVQPAGGGGGGAAIPDETPAAAPDVSAQDPAAAVAAIATLPPAQLVQSLAGVQSSVTNDVTRKRDHLSANPLMVETPAPGPTGDEAPGRTGDAMPRVERVEAVPAAVTPAPTPLARAAPLPTVQVSGPRIGGDPQGQLSARDAQALQSSLRQLPTTDPELALTAGLPPTIELTGDADPAHTDEQRQQTNEAIATAHAQGAEEAAAPLGENGIYSDVPQETLQAVIPAATTAAPAGQASLKAPSDAVAAIVEEEHGDEIRTAGQTTVGDLNARQTEHADSVTREQQATSENVAAASQAAADEQDQERTQARRQVTARRGDWTAAQGELVQEGNTDADATIREGTQRVASARTDAEARAAEHIDNGNREADQHRHEAERRATTERASAERESSGVLGWLADRARTFFDRVKRAITSIFESFRQLIRAAIDRVQRLAADVIEAGRRAVVGAIRWAGDRLIQIGDRVLAGFPGLRDRFRSAINTAVEGATAAVNAVAHGLTRGIQALLDAYAAVIDAALGLLQRGLLAVVDAYSAVVQGAIRAAQAVVQGFGVFMAIIGDIAANPVQWLRNLAAAAMDGVRNHLWRELQIAVKNWFNQKVEEVLGLGIAIWNLLTRGTLSIVAIGRMAWEGIKAAIPMILIQLLIEKVVSMIIPAAGALLMIVEGLQAAWGTISRIFQAIERFVGFLRAVRGGQAGRPFAQTVAAAAVVVIDFVANWLLRRIIRPARGVARRLRGIAQRIMARLRRVAQRIGRAVRRVGRRIRGAFRRMARRLGRTRIGRRLRHFRQRRRQRRQQNAQRRRQDAQRRLDRAVAAIRPEVRRMLQRGVGRAWLWTRLQIMRLRHRLTALTVENDRRIVARVNPRDVIESANHVELGAALEPILRQAEEVFFDEYEASRYAGQFDRRFLPLTEHPLRRSNEIEEILAYRRAAGLRGEIPEGFVRGERMLLRASASSASFRGLSMDGVPRLPLLSATVLPGGSYRSIRQRWARRGAPGSMAEISPSLRGILLLERARSPGMLPGMDLAAALAESGEATVMQATVGTLAPMAVSRSGTAAEYDRGVLPRRPHGDRTIAAVDRARRIRRARIRNIFVRLRQAVRAGRGQIIGLPNGRAEGLVRAFENWARAHLNRTAARDEVAIERLAMTLQLELQQFLRTYRG